MKPYKCRVEYLESTGTQWIDTGINVDTSTDEIKLYFQLIDTALYKWFFGEYDTNARIGLGSGDGENKRKFLYQQSATKVSDTQMYNKQHLFEINSNGGFLDGTKIRDHVNFASTSTIYLFNLNINSTSNYRCKSKIWKYEHKRNGVLIKELIPVLDNNGKPAMYDNVSGQLFYNQSTGADFSYGREIHPVEYLESTGTQYIDTGFKGKNNLQYKLKVNFTSLSTGGSNGIGGEYLGNASAYIGMVRANGHFTYLFNNTAVETTTTFYANTDYEIDSTMNTGNQVVKVNGETINTGTISGAFTSTKNIFLYAICSTNEAADVYGSLKMYYCQIYDNGTLVRDFIPCIDENNVPFMFDLVNCKIYENAGTGQFKVGANVEKNGSKKMMRKKLALMLANLKKKRPYYCEVEYLEGTGTQYIDTGLYGTLQSQVDVVFGMSSAEGGAAYNGTVFGGRTAQTSNTFTLFKLASATPQYFRFDYNGQKNVANATQITWNNTSKYHFEYNGSRCLTTNITTGESHTENLTPPSSTTTDKICLFCVNTNDTKGTYFSGRIYRYWYTDGTNTIDLIPVLDWNMTPCMYDKISGKLFYNQGSGSFTYGREIHYVDYLEGTGTQYIDLPFGFDKTDEIETKFFLTQTNASDDFIIAPTTWNNNNNRFGLGYYTVSTGYNMAYGNQGTPSTYLLPQTTYDTTKPYIWKYKDYVCSIPELGISRDFSSILFGGTTVNLRLFYGYNSLRRGIVYYYKHYKNGNLVINLVPAIDENGVGFMFDRVTHTISDNAGTGAFAYPPVELEYIESTGSQYIDTGIQPTDTYGYRIRNTYTTGQGEQCAIGCMDSGNRFVGVYTSGSANAISGAWGSFVGFLHSYTWTTGTILDVKCNYKNSRKMIIDNTEMKDISDVHITGTISNSIYIGARNYGSNVTKMQGRIYGTEITNNTDIIATFIPVFYNGEAGMLDKANNVFYANAGTGTFGVGKIVESEYES